MLGLEERMGVAAASDEESCCSASASVDDNAVYTIARLVHRTAARIMPLRSEKGRKSAMVIEIRTSRIMTERAATKIMSCKWREL